MQDENGSEVPDFQDCFDGADIFFRSKDKERFRLSLEAIKHGDRGLALIGANEGVLDHYSRMLVARLRDLEGFSLEVFLPNDTDSLLNRFNQILAKMTMEQARKPAEPSASVHLLVVNDARSVKQEQWKLLARLISDFPGTNARLILCIDKTGWPGYEKLLPMFGRQLYRWVVDTPSVDEAIQLTYAAQEYGYERDTDLLLEQVGLGDVVAPDNSEIMPGDIDILSEDTLMQDIGGGLVFSEDEDESDQDSFISAAHDRRRSQSGNDETPKLRDMGVTAAIAVLSVLLVCFIFYRLYPSEFFSYKELVVSAIVEVGGTDEVAEFLSDQSPMSELDMRENQAKSGDWQESPMNSSSDEVIGLQQQLEQAQPDFANVEEELAQVSNELSGVDSMVEDLDEAETAEIQENISADVLTSDEREATLMLSDGQITEMIQNIERDQRSETEQGNSPSVDQSYVEPARQQIEAVEQVRSLEEMAPLEEVELIGMIEAPRRSEDPIGATQQMPMIRPVEDPKNPVENNIEALFGNGITEAVESVEGSRSGDFFVQYIVFTSEAQATEFIDEYFGLAGALVVPIFLRGDSAFAVVAGPFSSLPSARSFAASEQLPRDYWFRSSSQLKAALRVNTD